MIKNRSETDRFSIFDVILLHLITFIILNTFFFFFSFFKFFTFIVEKKSASHPFCQSIEANAARLELKN